MLDALATTPRADGFRMPGEFEPHAGTWMLWPHRPDWWRLGGRLAQQAFANVATAIARFEPVTVGANPDQVAGARALLPADVRVVELASDDAWMRDCGPTFVVDETGRVRLTDWDFNSWGGTFDGAYETWDLDDMVPRGVAAIEGLERYHAPMVLEGGAINVDGEGTLLTTAECLLSPGRNPDLTREQIEGYLHDYLSVDKVIWLNRGLDPWETNGHVDDVACFVKPGVVVLSWTDDRDDWRYEVLAENYEILRAATDARGRPLEVHKMPLPDRMFLSAGEAEGIVSVDGTRPRRAGEEMAPAYLNFYVCNGGVVMPVFDDRRDDEARRVLERLYPDRTVVTVAGHEIILGGGCVHCITQQQPLGVDAPDGAVVGTLATGAHEAGESNTGGMGMTAVTVAATQMACSWDIEANLASAERLVREAAAEGANIILLQELFETPYFCIEQHPRHFDLARPFEGHSTIARMAGLAVELGVVLPVSFFERAGQVFFNSLAMIDADGSILGIYRKSHIPNGVGYQEKYYFSPGDTGFRVWRTRYGALGVGICWDQWFPETARCLALAGAEILFFPTAIGSEPYAPEVDSSLHWKRVQQGHAAANVIPVVVSNRIGVERGDHTEMTFYGASFIADHTGELVAEADGGSEAREMVVTASFDLDEVRQYREAWGLFRDRRPDLYGALATLDGRQR